MDTPHAFDLELTGFANGTSATVRITGNHTNVVSVTKGAEDVTHNYAHGCYQETKSVTDRSVLNVEDIFAFANETALDELQPLLERQIEMNMAIAEEGIRGCYGACIGKVLYRNGEASLRDKARAYAASVPVVVYARELGKTHEELLRAVLVSDLITIHQKTGIGCLSAYCGAISAGCGCGAGICYLLGGDYYAIAHTLVNAVAILSGTICDGAKPSCAAKIAMAVEAGIMGYEMTKAGCQFYGGDGIITKGVENTIRNIGRLAREGMSETDKEIIRIMLEKPDCR